MVALLILLTILVFLTADYFIQKRQAAVAVRERASGSARARGARVTPQIRYRTPHGVFFSPGHTWLYLEESGAARVGINDFAQSIIGRVDGVRTRVAGETVRKNDVILEVRHGNRTAKFRSPVYGVIEAVNTELTGRHDVRGIEPFSAAWMYRIRPQSTSETLQHMLLGNAAQEWLGREVQRLKVILSTIVPKNPVLGETLQDGGLPAWGLIDYLSEAEWKQVQEKIFD